MYRVKTKFQARNDVAKAAQKNTPNRIRPACFLIVNAYGAFVDAGAFVEGAGAGDDSLLQPVITALKARPNNTTKDSFFIGSRNFYWLPEKHK